VRISEIDAPTASDEQLLVFHRIEQACLPELVPGEPARSPEETIAYYRFPPTTHSRHHWLAGEDGLAVLYVHSPTAVFCDLLVAPTHRRRGVGTALLAAARARCAELGLNALHGDHATPAGAAFAARAGAVDGQRNLRSLLDLSDAHLTAPTAPRGWRLVTWIARVPDEHVESYARARAAMDDAPTPEGMEFPADDVERVRAMEESSVQRRRELRLTVALDEQGEVGAFTDLRVSPHSRVAFTDDTGTVTAHRGHGLATAVKRESLRALRRDHRDVRVVTTTNAEENAAMRHINERLGFRVAAKFTATQLSL
jgi:GNAT superfamily N-acetyltransferase